MPTWIALLRGINVGGRNIMPMAKLKLTMEAIACTKVQTYIQSGNVVFDSRIKKEKTLEKKLLDAIEDEFAFRPRLMLRSEPQLRAAISNNPFASATSKPKTLHFFFLDGQPQPEALASLENSAAQSPRSEQYKLVDRVFYLYPPEGFGKSKLASSVERKLAVSATARNYATIKKLESMLLE